MTAIADIAIPLERIQDLGRKLHLSEDGESTAEELADYEEFVRETAQAAEGSQWARLGLAIYLGIISRQDAEKIAEGIDEPRGSAEFSAEPTVEPTRDELIEELRVLVSDATNFTVDPIVAERIFTADGHILTEADHWGAHDTVIREDSYTVLSQALIGKEWPKNADGLTDDEFDAFLGLLKAAHDELLAELQVAQKD